MLIARLDQHVESGLLLCEPCSAKFPIVDGLPILLCYATPIHATFIERHPGAAQKPYVEYQSRREPADGSARSCARSPGNGSITITTA